MDRSAELVEMIARNLAIDRDEVVTDALLQDDLGADSLLLLALAEEIGKRYEIEIDPDDLAELGDVGELMELVEAEIAKK